MLPVLQSDMPDADIKKVVPCYGVSFEHADNACVVCHVHKRCTAIIIGQSIPAMLKAAGKNPDATPDVEIAALYDTTEANLAVARLVASDVPIAEAIAKVTAPPAPDEKAAKKQALMKSAAIKDKVDPAPTKVKAKKGGKAKEPAAGTTVEPVTQQQALALLDANGNAPDVHDNGTHAMPQLVAKPNAVEAANVLAAHAETIPTPASSPPSTTLAPETTMTTKKKKAAPAKAPPKKTAAKKAPPPQAAAPVVAKPEKAARAPKKGEAAHKKKEDPKATTKAPGVPKGQPKPSTLPADEAQWSRERKRSPFVAALKSGQKLERVYDGKKVTLKVFPKGYELAIDDVAKGTYPTVTKAIAEVTGAQTYGEGKEARTYIAFSIPRFFGVVLQRATPARAQLSHKGTPKAEVKQAKKKVKATKKAPAVVAPTKKKAPSPTKKGKAKKKKASK